MSIPLNADLLAHVGKDLVTFSNQDPVRRGNPGRSYAEALLGRLEFEFVRARLSDWSVSSLDTEFARNSDGSKRSSADRRQVFEHARNRGKPLPSDVVRRLDKNPELRGIRHIAESTFWALLSNPPTIRKAAYRLVERCLKRLDLVRLPVGLEEEWLARKWRSAKSISQNIQWRDESEIASTRIENLVLEYPKNLDLIALFGALYREACLTFEPEAANFLGIRFWMLLEDFLSQPGFGQVADNVLDYSVNRVIYDRDEVAARHGFNPNGSERIPGKAIGLLLPKEDWDVKELMHVTDS